jgi:hypothetical protein
MVEPIDPSRGARLLGVDMRILISIADEADSTMTILAEDSDADFFPHKVTFRFDANSDYFAGIPVLASLRPRRRALRGSPLG